MRWEVSCSSFERTERAQTHSQVSRVSEHRAEGNVPDRLLTDRLLTGRQAG